MEVYTPIYYLGRDKKGKPVLDDKNSGTYVIGLFANIESIARLVKKFALACVMEGTY